MSKGLYRFRSGVQQEADLAFRSLREFYPKLKGVVLLATLEIDNGKDFHLAGGRSGELGLEVQIVGSLKKF